MIVVRKKWEEGTIYQLPAAGLKEKHMILKSIILFLCLFLPSVHLSPAAEIPDPLVIAMRNDLPPMLFLNAEGEPAGIYVDIWKLWAQKTGKSIVFRPVKWHETLTLIQNGQADIHASVFYSDERAEWMLFSQPFYEQGVSLFFPVNQGGFADIHTLSGQKIGVVEGTYQYEYLRDTHPDIEVVLFSDVEGMINAARNKTIRAFLNNSAATLMVLNRLGMSGDFETDNQILYSKKCHAGVLKTNTELLDLIDRGFDAITNNELAKIETHWIPDPEKRYYRTYAREIRLTIKEENWLKKHNNIRIGCSLGFPPLAFWEENTFKGIYPDYIKLIGERTGIRFDLVPGLPSEMDGRLKNGEIDGVPVLNVPERKAYAIFTRPFMHLKLVIVTRGNMPFVSGLGMLKGMKMVVINGIRIHNRLLNDYPEIKKYPVNTLSEGIAAVSRSQADAIVVAMEMVAYLLKDYPDLKIAGLADIPAEPVMYAVRKTYPELASIFDKAIALITQEEHESILQKWFPVQIEYKTNWTLVLRWGLAVGIIFALILGMTIYWNRRMAVEIKQRKQAEKSLRESEEKYRRLVEGSPDIVYIYSLKQGALYWSPRVKDILGYASDQPYQHSFAWHDSIHPDDLPHVDQAIQETSKEGIFDIQYRIKNAQGKWLWFHDRLIGTRKAGEDIIIEGIATDITRQKQTEQELQKARDAAESANLAKSIFIANMSHELRTPLNAILGFCQVMSKDTGLSPVHREDIGIIQRSGELLLELINDVIDMAKIEAGRIQLMPMRFNLYFFMKNIEEMMIPLAKEKNLMFSMSYPSGIPIYIEADENRLRQVLMNLLENALKFTIEGGVTLRIRVNDNRLVRDEEPKTGSHHSAFRVLYFEIEDTGMGIAPDEIPNLFAPFVQTASGLRVQQGMGLGLALCREFIRLMGGDIHVESQVGKGSVFAFDIRAAMSHGEEGEPEDHPLKEPAAENIAHLDLSALPPEWLDHFSKTVVVGREELILDLLNQIRADYPDISKTFEKWVHEFRFDKLIALTEGEKKDE